MATERKSPDTIAAITNLAPNNVAYIQDDPDSPDGNWLVASGNNINTDVRTTFPTPTGNPTVGADLQEFKAWVRRFDEGQTGTPEARIELWENGVLVRAGANEEVTTSGHMVTFPWNASELGTVDGSLVECKVVGTKSGGSPTARNTVDVGAVEWNVEYSVGVATETIQKSLKYTVVAPVSAIQKSLQYEVQTAATETIQKSLKYTVVITPTAITKGLEYAVIVTPSAITKGLGYSVVITPTVMNKSLEYQITAPVTVQKSLKYTVPEAATIQKSLQYDVSISQPQSVTKNLEYVVEEIFKTILFASTIKEKMTKEYD